MTDDLISRAEAVAARYAHRFDEDPIGVSAGLFRAMVAALADAAATTTPAEQAGDVRQAWRVKPLVWHNYDAWTWWAESTSGTYRVEERNGTWRATLNLPMTEHIIYEYETDGTPNDFEAAHLACESDHAARITAAIELATLPAAVVEAMERALRHADQVSRDLGWHRIYDETGSALADLQAWRAGK